MLNEENMGNIVKIPKATNLIFIGQYFILLAVI